MRFTELTLKSTQTWITDAGVLVVCKVKKKAAVIAVQKDALIVGSFNNVCSKTFITDINSPDHLTSGDE